MTDSSSFGRALSHQAPPPSWPSDQDWDPNATIQFVVWSTSVWGGKPDRGDLFVGPADCLHLVCGFEGPGGAMYKLEKPEKPEKLEEDIGKLERGEKVDRLKVTAWGRPADQDGNARRDLPLMEASFVATMIGVAPYFGDPREVVVREYVPEAA
jgi:hypothetical protein